MQDGERGKPPGRDRIVNPRIFTLLAAGHKLDAVIPLTYFGEQK